MKIKPPVKPKWRPPRDGGRRPAAQHRAKIEVERRRQSERQLRIARQVIAELRCFEQMFDRVGDGIVLADRVGRILRANAEAARLLGLPLMELLDRSLPTLLPLDSRERLMATVEAVLDQQKRQAVVEVSVTGATQIRTLRATISALDAQQNTVVVDLHDASELHSALDQKKQHETISALAGATAHKLNQPLTAVIGYVQLLRRAAKDSEQETAIARIEDAAQEIAALVREIGRITKFQTQRYGGGANQILKLGD